VAGRPWETFGVQGNQSSSQGGGNGPRGQVCDGPRSTAYLNEGKVQSPGGKKKKKKRKENAPEKPTLMGRVEHGRKAGCWSKWDPDRFPRGMQRPSIHQKTYRDSAGYLPSWGDCTGQTAQIAGAG